MGVGDDGNGEAAEVKGQMNRVPMNDLFPDIEQHCFDMRGSEIQPLAVQDRQFRDRSHPVDRKAQPQGRTMRYRNSRP